MGIEQILAEKGIVLPPAPPRGGLYTPMKLFAGGTLVYGSGFGPATPDYECTGKLGGGVSIPEGQMAARHCMLNMLAAFKRDVGDLDRIGAFVKMLALVASENDFYEQPAVANGATELLAEVFGEGAGLPARSAIGVNVLPGNIAVEIEVLIELKS